MTHILTVTLCLVLAGCSLSWEGCPEGKKGACISRDGGKERASYQSSKKAKSVISDDGNNGHGNDDDHDDDSNPGKGK